MNRITAIGNLGGDATVRNVGNEEVVNFNIAVTKRWKNKDGEKQERTTWISCSYWNKAALAPFLLKGTKILVEGEPSVRTYKNSKDEVIAQQDMTVMNLELLDRKPSESNSTGNADPAGVSTAIPEGENGAPPADDDLPF
jgi:single-strand DNA-binding protein